MNHISPEKVPIERYAREIGLFALVGVKIKDILKPPPIVVGWNPANQLRVGSLSHCLQGFLQPRWCRISVINSIYAKLGYQATMSTFNKCEFSSKYSLIIYMLSLRRFDSRPHLGLYFRTLEGYVMFLNWIIFLPYFQVTGENQQCWQTPCGLSLSYPYLFVFVCGTICNPLK